MDFDAVMNQAPHKGSCASKRSEMSPKSNVHTQTEPVTNISEEGAYANFAFDEKGSDLYIKGNPSTLTKEEKFHTINGTSVFTISRPSNGPGENQAEIQKKIKDDDAGFTIQIKPKPLIDRKLQITLTIMNCIMATIPIGYLYCLGVIFVQIIDEYRATRAEASPILSIYTTILFGFGGIFGPIMNKFNGGFVCVISGVVAFIGCVVSYFANSIPLLILGIGVLTGFGLSAPFLLPFVIIGEIFEPSKRTTMITVIGLAPGFGGVIFPYLTGYLMEEYGWRGVVLIYSGLMLNTIPFGFMNAFVKKVLNKSHASGNTPSLREILNFSLFRKMEFLVLVFCVFLMNTLFPTINLFFVDMIRGKGYDVSTGSALLSINGFVNMGGRLFSMAVTPFIKIPRMTQWTIYLFIVSLSISLYVVFNQYEYLLGTCILYGFFWGMCIISYPAMLLEIAGQKRYANAMGYTNLIGGVSGLIGAPIAGFIKDTTGTYDLVYYATTGLGSLACCLLSLTMIRKHYRRKKEEAKKNVDSTNL